MRRKKRGSALEAELEQLHAIYRQSKRARVIHVPTQLQILEELGGAIVRARKGKKLWCDWLGVLPGGRGVSFESKKSEGKYRFPLGAVPVHQLNIMHEVSTVYGVPTFLYLRHHKVLGGRDYVVPWQWLLRNDLATWDAPSSRVVPVPSVTWEDLEPMSLPPGRTWLDCVMRRDVWVWNRYEIHGWKGTV